MPRTKEKKMICQHEVWIPCSWEPERFEQCQTCREKRERYTYLATKRNQKQ